MLLVIIGIVIVFIIVVAVGIYWYRTHEKKKQQDICEKESEEQTLFSKKMKRIRKRLDDVEHQINCLYIEELIWR